MIDLYSVHNIREARESNFKLVPARLQRARDALLLAIHLHQVGALTLSLREAVDVLRAKVPPTSGKLEVEYSRALAAASLRSTQRRS